MYVIPGTYDLLVDATSYLDCVYINRTLQEGDELDLGYYEMLAGDVDKNGLISMRRHSIYWKYFWSNLRRLQLL